MLKIIGAVIVILASVSVGFTLGDSIKRRLYSLSLLGEFIEYISMNITMYKTPLEEIYRSVPNKELQKCGFVSKLKNGIFSAALDSGLLIGDEETEIIRSFSEKLGSGSVEETEKLCTFTVSRLKTIEDQLRRDLPDKQRVYKTVSLLAGASAVIILI